MPNPASLRELKRIKRLKSLTYKQKRFTLNPSTAKVPDGPYLYVNPTFKLEL